MKALADRGRRYPTVVADRDGVIVAMAWVSQYRPRACYDGIGEFSVYTDRASRGRGAGRAVMEGLIAECERRGFWKLVARIFPENTASRTLCRRLGFREVGVYQRHGKLDGEWRDCVIVERLLGEAAAEPVNYSEHMHGLHREIWEGIEPQEFVRQERAEWQT